MDSFSILNYQGSKKNLISFIHSNTINYIDEHKAILDIFSGSCSVGYSYKQNYRVFANDSEQYSSIIAKALLCKALTINKQELTYGIDKLFYLNTDKLSSCLGYYLKKEFDLLANDEAIKLIGFYKNYPTIWNSQKVSYLLDVYNLFSTYYAGSYFGIKQAFDIDSLRFAIEVISQNNNIKSVLLSCLFFAMKECVFSKDGHMAQPLNQEKNLQRLQNQRNKSITQMFYKKLSEFFSDSFVGVDNGNVVFNLDFEDILKSQKVQNEVGFIYADPPYTDMQYSRYYHLLNVVSKYNYPAPTVTKNGFTKGLYTENRFQSKLSQKHNCMKTFSNLIDFAKTYNKNIAISFAYPKDPLAQKTDRYVMSIEEIISACKIRYGNKNVIVESMDYSHSNNRNTQAKKVLEYLIVCRGV